jgi:hypothetical protein
LLGKNKAFSLEGFSLKAKKFPGRVRRTLPP